MTKYLKLDVNTYKKSRKIFIQRESIEQAIDIKIFQLMVKIFQAQNV